MEETNNDRLQGSIIAAPNRKLAAHFPYHVLCVFDTFTKTLTMHVSDDIISSIVWLWFMHNYTYRQF